MAQQLRKTGGKERHLCYRRVWRRMCSPLARMQAIVGLIEAQPQKAGAIFAAARKRAHAHGCAGGRITYLVEAGNRCSVQMEKDRLKNSLPLLRQLVEDCQSIAEQNHQRVSFW